MWGWVDEALGAGASRGFESRGGWVAMDLGVGDFWRIDGPGSLRFIIQPLLAILLGLRDGHRDAKAGAPPYFWLLLADPERRPAALKQGARAILISVVLATIMDSVFQFMFLGRIHPGVALVV